MVKHGLLASAAVVMALGFLPLAAQAQSKANQCLPGGGQQASQVFQKIDQDGNGMISMEEFRDCLDQAGVKGEEMQDAEQLYRTADQNADDRLSSDEFQQIAAAGQQSEGQQMQQAQDQQKQGQQQAQGEQQAQGQQGDTPAATITVDKTAPDVTVKQPAPQITVTVDQPKPEVQVSQGEPQVDVEKSAAKEQANVEVQTEEPQVVVRTNEGQEGQQDQTQAGQKDQQQMTNQDQLAEQQKPEQQKPEEQAGQQQAEKQMEERVVTPSGEADGGQMAAGTLDEDAIRNDPNLLLDRAVISENGEEIGDIEEIVIDPSTNELYAVIGVGGFLGIGERQVVVPLKNLNVQDDRVFMPGTEDELRQMPEYQDDQWQPLT